MNKFTAVSIVIGLVLVLSACGSISNANAVPTASTTLSLEGQLLVGTFKLESTSLAVSTTQAEQLLPLWETLQSLASSGTAASQEVDAVISQIESTMSTQQISSITAMKLSQQDLVAATADAGLSASKSSSLNTTSTNTAQVQGGAGIPGAGVPPADMGGAMPAAMDTQSAGQTQNSTTQTVTSQSAGSANQVSPALINALVELLMKKIG
jgi:hypothetical protein